MVVANTRTKSIQKQKTSIDVDKVGSNKPLASKSVSPISKALCLSYKTTVGRVRENPGNEIDET